MDEIKTGLTSNRILDGSPTTTGHGDRAYDDGHGDIRHPADVDFQETAADSLRLSALSPSVIRLKTHQQARSPLMLSPRGRYPAHTLTRL